jgi:3alpha(or 20beta)-hydroxysteroid dehydrogenase
MARFDNRTTLITGAVGGIGSATAERIAEEGGAVIVADLDQEACRAFAASLPNPERHHGIALDVTSEPGWQEVATWLTETGLQLHCLVNNAGIGSVAPVVEESMEMWSKVLDIDLTGVWLGMKHLGPLVQGENPGGSIVNISSILGTVGGTGGHAAYHAAKGGVRTLTKNAAIYWIQKGVRVNSVHPGYVATPGLLKRHGHTEHYQAMLRNSPMGRLAEPHEIAAAIAFLASGDSTYVSGSELYVDGGYTAR